MRILRTIYPNLTATNKHNLSTKLKFQMVIMFKQKKKKIRLRIGIFFNTLSLPLVYLNVNGL